MAWNRWQDIREAADYDVVFVSKSLGPGREYLRRQLIARNARMVYDFDDVIWHGGYSQTLAAYNLETIRSFLSKMAVVTEAARKPRTRKKRREMTWRDVVAIGPETGPDPPPG